MAVYQDIRKVRKILNELYHKQDHKEARKMLDVGLTLYNAIRYHNVLIVAEKITDDIHQKMKDFISAHEINKEESIPYYQPSPEEAPPEPCKVFVNNDVENPHQLQLKGKALDFVKAMADLREAMQPFYGMGYHIGVTLYRRRQE